MSEDEHHCVILRLLDLLEVSQRVARMKSCRAFLYLVQGVFSEVSCLYESDSDADETTNLHMSWSRKNAFLLYKYNVFSVFVELLNLEIE